MTDNDLERALFFWPTVVERAEGDWAKGFALSIAKRARWKNWKPTKKQWAIMCDMVADVAPDAVEVELIED